MAISLYRSRGKALWGFEFKVSRNDWLKELKQPEKAESIMRYCHHWALVVPDKKIVQPGELPSTWGMYVAQKNRLKCLVSPPKLEPLPMSMTMFTALAYAIDQKHKRAEKASLEAEFNRGYEQGKKRDYDRSWEKLYKDLDENVKAFETASGLQIKHGWPSPEKIGGAVRTLLDAPSSIRSTAAQARRTLETVERIKTSLQKQVEALDQISSGNLNVDDDDD